MNQAQHHHPFSPSPKAHSVWLEKNIVEVEQLLVADREAFERNPQSFSARLSLASTENRLAELREQLQSEKVVYLCADCGRKTTLSTDDPIFGLCPACEQKFHHQATSWQLPAPRESAQQQTGRAARAAGHGAHLPDLDSSSDRTDQPHDETAQRGSTRAALPSDFS